MNAHAARIIIHAPHLAPKLGAEQTAETRPATVVRTVRVARKPLPVPAEPTVTEMATNFAGAMERWAAGGFKTASRDEYDVRSTICEPCEFWDGAARFGLGKCKAPGCGCTTFKRWLATEQCKHPQGSKWPAVAEPMARQARRGDDPVSQFPGSSQPIPNPTTP